MTTEKSFLIALIPNSKTRDIISTTTIDLATRHFTTSPEPHIPLFSLNTAPDDLEIMIYLGIESWKKKVEDSSREKEVDLIPTIKFKSLEPQEKGSVHNLGIQSDVVLNDSSVLESLREEILKSITTNHEEVSVEVQDTILPLFVGGKSSKKLKKIIKYLSKKGEGKEAQVVSEESGTRLSLNGIEGFKVETIVVATKVEGEGSGWDEVSRISLV